MTSPHTVTSYDEELEALRACLSRMAGLAESQLHQSVSALMERDTELAARVIDDDRKLDELEIEAEERAVGIIARRSPLADDLRELIAAIKVASALERIGDYAKNIAKRTTALARSMPHIQLGVLPEMADEVRRRLPEVLTAMFDRDSTRAMEIRAQDERVDMLYDSLFRELLTYMMEQPQLITVCTHLLFIAKNIERMGDQVSNIAELAYYVAEARAADEPPSAIISRVHSSQRLREDP